MQAVKVIILGGIAIIAAQIGGTQGLSTLDLPTAYQNARFEIDDQGRLLFPCLNPYTMARLTLQPQEAFSEIKLGYARSATDSLYESHVPFVPSRGNSGYKIALWEASFRRGKIPKAKHLNKTFVHEVSFFPVSKEISFESYQWGRDGTKTLKAKGTCTQFPADWWDEYAKDSEDADDADFLASSRVRAVNYQIVPSEVVCPSSVKSSKMRCYEFSYFRKNLEDEDVDANYVSIKPPSTGSLLVLSQEWVVRSNSSKTMVLFERLRGPQGSKLSFAAIYSLSDLGRTFEEKLAERDPDIQAYKASNDMERKMQCEEVESSFQSALSKIKKKDKNRETKKINLERERDKSISKINSQFVEANRTYKDRIIRSILDELDEQGIPGPVTYVSDVSMRSGADWIQMFTDDLLAADRSLHR